MSRALLSAVVRASLDVSQEAENQRKKMGIGMMLRFSPVGEYEGAE